MSVHQMICIVKSELEREREREVSKQQPIADSLSQHFYTLGNGLTRRV